MERPIYITENCLVALITSCLEIPHKEVGGFLIGKEENRFINGGRTACLTVDVAYQIRTCKSGKSFWQPENIRAYHRIVDTIKSMGFNIVGEYHSHIHNVAELSEEDKNFIKQEVADLKVSNWIEMILNIESKTYTRKQKQSFDCNFFSKKIRCTIRGIRDPLAGYSITAGTYCFDPATGVFKEASVYVP
ncbi:MAG: Mov34/MPN/PAD-1 family protein [Candidatus Bathyarchaeota archaeon]|jgi:proteasome lid subunit RPN8/RPN11|nr:Mov34/MPN/PAD-1 family protein [Candidatus Bathyarchaeota archaeon]